MTDSEGYYLKRKKRYLFEFDLVARSARCVLVKYFGKDASNLVLATRSEFESLIQKLPFIGGRQPFTEFVVFTGMLLAVYRTCKEQGKSVEETGALVYEIGRSFLQWPPAVFLRMFGRMNFSRRSQDRLQLRAAESHRRIYPDDYVYNFVEGDRKNFDFGVDYLECASCKFLAREGAPELAPYLCPVDRLYSETLGWGLTRTMTLAEGADRCDFRFKKGGKTNVAVPAALQHLL